MKKDLFQSSYIDTRYDTRQRYFSSTLSAHAAAHGQAHAEEGDKNWCVIGFPYSSTTEIGSPRKNVYAGDVAANMVLYNFFEGDLVSQSRDIFF